MASTEKIEAFLAERRNVVVAGIRRDGRPHLTPNWFSWDGERFYVSTTRHLRALAAEGRVLLAITPDEPLSSRTTTGLGTDGWGTKSLIHVGFGGALIFEIVLTAIFVFVILRVTSATGNPATAAIAIGLTLTVVHLVGIPITGTSVNPARSLGPALVVGGTALSQVWLFIVAPLVGGALAAGLHRLFYREEDAGLAPEARQADAAENSATS
jgi:Major intrinsic protein/Pyridoxamine 5'-phosphate oxidase